MDSDRSALAAANHLAAHVSAVGEDIRDAYQGKAPNHSPGNSSSFSSLLSSTDPPSFAGPNGFLGSTFLYDSWQVLIGSNRALAEAGIEYDAGTQIDDEPAVSRLLELMRTDKIEIIDAINDPESRTFHTVTRPGTLLPPPLAMPERPSTTFNMRDNVNFDISEFFDIDAAAEPSSNPVSHSDGPPMPDGDSAIDGVLPPDITEDKFDPAVSFEEYLKLSKLQEGVRTSKSYSFIEKRGYLMLAPKGTDTGIAPRDPDDPKYRANPDVDVLKHAFKAGGEDFFLPAFSDPIHDAEFAAFVVAGRSVHRQFRGVRPEFESKKTAAIATPSPSRVSGQQAPDMSPAMQQEDELTRAGLIYVAHILQQNPELSNKPEDTGHSYTKEEIQWARNCLSDDVKVWMKQSCGVIGAKKITRTGLDKVLEKVALEPGLLLNHTADPSSQKPENQMPKYTADNLNYWAEHDRLMSFPELDAEWDAFEKANPPAPTTVDDLQMPAEPPDVASASAVFSPASVASFITADDDEMSIIPTLSTPNPTTHTAAKSQMADFNTTLTPRAGASAPGDLLIAPVVTKLSEILLDSREQNGTGGVPQAVKTNGLRDSGRDGSPNALDYGEMLRGDHASLMNISYDENVIADTYNSPMSIGEGDRRVQEHPNTLRASHQSIEAASENESRAEHGTVNITETQRETDAVSESVVEYIASRQIIHSPTRPALSTKQSTGKNHSKTPKGITFSAEVSASSPVFLGSFSNSCAASDTPPFTCTTCNKAYKRKAYLMKHEAECICKPKPVRPPRLAIFAGVPILKLSMTDQELIDNGLPSMEARNHKRMPYCTACNKEFSTVSRLRSHVLQSCPILRGREVYSKPLNQQLAVEHQDLALAFPSSITTGYVLMDEGESEIDNSRPFSKHDLGSLKESLNLSDTPINVVRDDDNFAPNTINGARPSPAIKHALFPVSVHSPDEIKFPKINEGTETPGIRIRRLPGQAVHLTSQQVQQLNIPLRSDTDWSVMEETNIGEKVFKANSMAEIPALRQSYDTSPLKSATPSLLRSAARSENIQGSPNSHVPTSKLGGDTKVLKGIIINNQQTDTEQNDKSEGPLLPIMRDNNADDNEKHGLKYPARMRLFSEELALSSPHKSDPLEPFEDLPQLPKRICASNPGGLSPGFARSTPQPASAALDIAGNPSTVTFSFTNESECAIATQTLEELITGSIDSTLQSLRMWPSFCMKPSASKSTFEFKVTAPQNLDLVTTLRELFPLMVIKVQGNLVYFVPDDMGDSNSGSPTALMPGATEAPAVVVVKAKKSTKVEKQGVEQPRRSSRVSSGEFESASQTIVKTNMEDGYQDPKKVKRRRSDSTFAELHAGQGIPVPADKKRQKTND